MRKILVTGGAGYVGSILIRNLLQDGYYTVCVDNLMFGGESLIGVWDIPHFQFHKCDINNKDEVDKILRQHNFYAVIHLAAIVGDPACKRQPELAVDTNWNASKYLFEQSMSSGIPRFIFASTCSNYGKMADPESYIDEGSTLAPVSLYAELKVKFENLILHEIPPKDSFYPTVLRFSTVYGISPRMRFDLTVNEFTKELASGRELVIFGEQFWRPYCHVLDFSRAILTVLRADSDKVAYSVFNVGDTKENYTKKMIIEELLKQFSDAKIKYVKKEEDPRDYRVCFDKIEKELGFKISATVPDGIKEIKKILELGIIKNPEDQRFYNIPHTTDGR